MTILFHQNNLRRLHQITHVEGPVANTHIITNGIVGRKWIVGKQLHRYFAFERFILPGGR